MSDPLITHGEGVTEAEAKAAFALEQRIRATIDGMRVVWVDLARDLYNFDTTDSWRALGYASIDEWLASPHIEIGRRWFYVLKAIWKQFVIDAGIEPDSLRELEPSKLQEVAAAVRRQQVEPARALADVKELSRNDLRQLYGGDSTKATPAGLVPDTSTHYEATDEPAYVRCPTCNSRVKEDQIT